MLSRPTITDIARAAGVSKGTVSRVINGHATVASVTRERVSAVMNQMGYEPDQAARLLSWRRGLSLGLSVGERDPRLSPYMVLFRRALDEAAGPGGLQLLDIGEDLAGLSRHPSGVLLMHVRDEDPRLAALRARGVPFALVGHHPACAWVAPDDVGGAQLATRQLTLLGHRDLAYLGGGDGQVQRDRCRGAELAAREAGAGLRLIPAEYSVLGGYRATRRAWEGGVRFTGLVAGCDEMACGAIAALQDLGLRVSGDVSVVGFDGLPELPLPVRLTTVSQDVARIAATALALVQEGMQGAPARGEYIPVRLSPGDTVGPPHSALHAP